MTWIIHRGNRDEIINSSKFYSIEVRDDKICLRAIGSGAVSLTYDTKADANQAFGYLMEAIKRGDKLTSL